MSQAQTQQLAAQEAAGEVAGDQGDQGAERSSPGDLRGPQQQMAPPAENQHLHERPAHTPQPAGSDSNVPPVIGYLPVVREQVTQGHEGAPQQHGVPRGGSFLPGQGNQGDQIAEHSYPGDLRGPQQEMAPGENQHLHESPAHTPQSAGLDSNVLPVIGHIPVVRRQVTPGDQGAPQQQGVPRGGSFLPGQVNEGDQIAQRSCLGDLRGPQQQMAPPDENQHLHELPAHTTQLVGLDLNLLRVLVAWMMKELGPVTQGHQDAPQQQGVPSGGGFLRGQANQHKRPAHTPQPAGLDLNLLRVLAACITNELGPITQGHQVAPQQPGVPRGGSFLPGQVYEGDQIAQRSYPGDLRGPQQQMAPPDDNQHLHERPAHTPQPAGLNLNSQQVLGPVSRGHQDAPQQKGLPRPRGTLNAKQIGAIIRRRQKKLKAASNTARVRKTNVHKPRHMNVKTRLSSGGQFLPTPGQKEALVKADSKGHPNAGEEAASLVIKEDSSQGLQGAGSNSQSRLVQDSHQGLPDGWLNSHRSEDCWVQGTMMVTDSSPGLRNRGSSSSQRMLFQDSNQALPYAGFANNPMAGVAQSEGGVPLEADTASLQTEPSSTRGIIGLDSEQPGLQDGGSWNSHGSERSGEQGNMIVQGSTQDLQDERLSNSESMLVRDSNEGLQSGGLANPPKVGVHQGGVQQPKRKRKKKSTQAQLLP